MKKNLLIILLPILIIILIVLAIDNKKEQDKYLLTINTLNNYLFDKDQSININFYSSNLKFPFENNESYESFIIKDNNSDNKLKLDLNKVTYSHTEEYLGNKYDMYTLMFKIPNLENDINYDNASLLITFFDQKKLELEIGNFNLMYLDYKTSLDWKSIDSKKIDNNDLSISKIIIELNKEINISNIFIGSNMETDFTYNDNVLAINIKEKELYVYNLPVIIKSEEDKYYYLNNHKYVKDYNLLSKTKDVNKYEFDWF